MFTPFLSSFFRIGRRLNSLVCLNASALRTIGPFALSPKVFGRTPE
jgi:hypothetical protein